MFYIFTEEYKSIIESLEVKESDSEYSDASLYGLPDEFVFKASQAVFEDDGKMKNVIEAACYSARKFKARHCYTKNWFGEDHGRNVWFEKAEYSGDKKKMACICYSPEGRGYGLIMAFEIEEVEPGGWYKGRLLEAEANLWINSTRYSLNLERVEQELFLVEKEFRGSSCNERRRRLYF